MKQGNVVKKDKQMSFERIAGLLFSGFMVKIYAIAGAIWMAYEAATFIRHAFAAASAGFTH